MHQYVVGVGFGSPLMALTGLNSMAVHLFGGTGVGKTTAQYAAMSLWGNPSYYLYRNRIRTTHV